jgi:Cupin domain
MRATLMYGAGDVRYQVDGQAPTMLEAGEVFFVPAETFHAVKNVGRGNAAELATYLVEEGKPLAVRPSEGGLMPEVTPSSGKLMVVLVHGAFADASSWNGVMTAAAAVDRPTVAADRGE